MQPTRNVRFALGLIPAPLASALDVARSMTSKRGPFLRVQPCTWIRSEVACVVQRYVRVIVCPFTILSAFCST